MRLLALFLLFTVAPSAYSGAPPPGAPESSQDLYVIRVREHSGRELAAALDRASARAESIVADPLSEPIQLVLSGDEIRLFLRSEYVRNKSLINKAARLDALGIIEVKACETWLRYQEISPRELDAFVDTVPFATDTLRRLTEEGYSYF